LPNPASDKARTNGQFVALLLANDFDKRDEDSAIPLFNYQELIVLIQSVELVALPGAPSYQEKIYRAHLATGDSVDLFQAHWDVPLAPDSLIGLSVQAARQLRNERMLAIAQGQH
jgi:hypothetical protein